MNCRNISGDTILKKFVYVSFFSFFVCLKLSLPVMFHVCLMDCILKYERDEFCI